MTGRPALDDWLQQADKVLAMVTKDYVEQWPPICWAQKEGSTTTASTASCGQPPTHPAGLCEQHAAEILGV